MITAMSSGAHELCREKMTDDETVDIYAGLLLVGGVADKLDMDVIVRVLSRRR